MRVLSWQTLLCCLALWNLAGCSSDPDPADEQSSKAEEEPAEKKSDLPTTPAFALPKSSLCRVYSNEPGFQVFTARCTRPLDECLLELTTILFRQYGNRPFPQEPNDLPEILAFGPDRATAGILACAPVMMDKPPPRL